MQELISVNNALLPVIEVYDVKYYPTKYVFEKVLGRKGLMQLHRKDEYKNYIKRLIVDWSFKGTSKQACYCMCKEGWRLYFKTIKLATLSSSQISAYNELCKAIGVEECMSNGYNSFELNEYHKDCIEEYINNTNNCSFKICTRCKNKLPLSSKFFTKDNRSRLSVTNTCRECYSNVSTYFMKNTYMTSIYKELGITAYHRYKNDINLFYDKYCHNNNFILQCDYSLALDIIKRYYDNGVFGNDYLYLDWIKNNFNFDWKPLNYKISNQSLIEFVSQNKCKTYPFLYNSYKLKQLSYDEGVEILRNYIEYNNIVIDDILGYEEYSTLIDKAKLTQFTSSRYNQIALNLIIELYSKEYSGYKFKYSSVNYYKNKDNCIFDMKWLIEKDLKIPIEKIPLYVTRYSLTLSAKPLYTAMRGNGYYSDLFIWINDCYPNKFIELDFNINPYRSEFDSLEEAQVYEEIKKVFNGVIYNDRKSENKIEINGMFPDFIILTNKGCYLVEYFGLYSDTESYKSSSRLVNYKEKMEIKNKKYIELEKVGYKHLYILPKDLKNNFKGLKDKLELIK